ncbi:hypothetical protein KV102_05110 [Mumia sp. zg.B53]|uniref:hypothetical protein n=1 Tax=unclassified Mumia TaxID=2621872 RepID=UPI001C6F3649|nr:MULTISPECIES: hypothetical protein [unclassified Mumia]MBW9204404.1 hypothetical protein [Mumia sp. zg.B17]MBW9209611.1 hypothetical protein [Mumia sp. zg.B21]MBW9214215.1 hypothetical protein [Mumia sp. zg.B53]
MRRSQPFLVAAALAAVACLPGCSGGGAQPVAADPSATASSSAPTPASKTRAAPEDLLSLRCVATADPKVWTAQGVIVNSASTADYRLTVIVASPGSTRAAARRIVIPKVSTGVDTPFTVDRLPVNPGSAPSCRVQLVRLG